MTNRLTLITVVSWTLLIAAHTMAHADRDIVYSEADIHPIKLHEITCHHLYRINADGTGKTLLTSGECDDTQPIWSPDGKWIVFYRSFTPVYDPPVDEVGICVIAADGGAVKWDMDWNLCDLDTPVYRLVGWTHDSSAIVVDTWPREDSLNRSRKNIAVLTGGHIIADQGRERPLSAADDSALKDRNSRFVRLAAKATRAFPGTFFGGADKSNRLVALIATTPVTRISRAHRRIIEANTELDAINESVCSLVIGNLKTGRKNTIVGGFVEVTGCDWR